MLDVVPTSWLVDQSVPLVYFIIALLTRPSQWAGKLHELAGRAWPTAETREKESDDE